MRLDDFRCMWRGRVVRSLSDVDKQSMIAHPVPEGNGKRALLMLHGFASSPAVFRELIPAIQHYDAIVVPAYPNHADSVESFQQVHFDTVFSSVRAQCQTMCERFEEVDVLGLSIGGLMACQLDALFPLTHLFLLAPALHLRKKFSVIYPILKLLKSIGFDKVRNMAGDFYSKGHCEIAYRQLPIAAILNALAYIHRHSHVGTLRANADVFLGQHDHVIDGNAVATYMQQSNAQANIHWLKKSAHILPLDGDIDTLLKIINDHSRHKPEVS